MSVLAVAAGLVAMVAVAVLASIAGGDGDPAPATVGATVASGTVTFDGRTCSYAGERVASSGQRATVTVHNLATEPVRFVAWSLPDRPDPQRFAAAATADLRSAMSGTGLLTELDVDAVRRGATSITVPSTNAWIGLACLTGDGAVHPATVMTSVDGTVSVEGAACRYDGATTFRPGETFVVGQSPGAPLRGVLVMRLRTGVTLDDVRAAEFGSRTWNYDLGQTITSQVGPVAGPVPVATPATGESLGLACLIGHQFVGVAVISPE
jgi:hypothetical protein